MFDGKDACSKDIWDFKELAVSPYDRQGNLSEFQKALLFPLQPWTQYAVYVEAVTIKSK